MPEGHTIHRLAGHLSDAFAGEEPMVSSPQGRFSESAALLDGTTFESAEAWGKHLFVDFAAERVLHVHLGLIGKFSVTPYADGLPAPRGAVRLRLATSAVVADLRGPITCALRTPEEVGEVIARTGPDPLRLDADPDRAWDRIHRSRKSVGALLMDQDVVAGIGNLYRCELLWRHRIDPFKLGNKLRRSAWDAIWEDLVRLMRVGVITGRIVTDDKQVEKAEAAFAANGTAVVRRPKHAVYKHTDDPCPRCGTKVRTQVMAGRNLFWCPRCQRHPAT